MDHIEIKDTEVLEADTVYLLMKKGFPISRNVRAQWKLQHLDAVVKIQNTDDYSNEEMPDLEIVSILPKYNPASWSTTNCTKFYYRITSTTSIIFLAHKYRMVFNLDLSPSLATVDIQYGEIVTDEVCLATKQCLEGITRPFTVPGSIRVMKPEIYVTVIAHTPFFTSPAQQVLVQGWLVTIENINSLMEFIEKQLSLLEKKVASVTSIVNNQLEILRAKNEGLVGGLFEENWTNVGKNNNGINNVSMISPEISFINMLRFGMLALSLLPEHSCAHLVVVTDGIVGITDVHALDSVVQQLRATTVACSFLHVGSLYHPHCANGLVPYQDLLFFLATATLGSYMTFTPKMTFSEHMEMNIYHKNFLCWQLYRTTPRIIAQTDSNDWRTENLLFYGYEAPPLLRKKQIDDKVTCTLHNLLCCRLREGYLMKKVLLRDGFLEICFILPWKNHVSIEYLVSCPWISRSLAVCNTIQYTVTIEAPYEFLHDITCLSKKPLKSQFRQSVVSRFWAVLTSLTESDNMLAHFSCFPGINWTWYNVPDTIKSGMPVFYLSSSSPSLVLLSDAACPQFGQIWKPIVSLEPHQWARWMHCQRVTLVLSHDRPLPKHLHLANQSGRFQCVQYRQASTVLYAMLKNWATFVLVENHTYIQFIYKEMDKPPVSFSLINVHCKALCVVLNVAFAGGTEGAIRHHVMTDLLDRLSKLTLPNRPTEQRETFCCTIVHKALEKILIKYERMPMDLNTITYPDGSQLLGRNTSMLTNSSTSTLSRYLHHSRWLWLIKKPLIQTIPGIVLSRLNISAIARILSTITKVRLSEGFNFAYSAAGIINMVLEVQMYDPVNEQLRPCIIQYILFPPHVIHSTSEHDSISEDDTDDDAEAGGDDNESSGDFQIVTEIWIEPQCGFVKIPSYQKAAYMNSLEFHQLPEIISEMDKQCIDALLTLEYLNLMCQVIPSIERTMNSSISGIQFQDVQADHGSCNSLSRPAIRSVVPDFCESPPVIDERIHSMLFIFDIMNVIPKCQQAELLFSMFDDGASTDCTTDEGANKILIDGLLDCIRGLHNKELLLSAEESRKFTEMLSTRARNEASHKLSLSSEIEYKNNTSSYPQWKCYIKRIGVTHVIVTVLPASKNDVQFLQYTRIYNDNNLTNSCRTTNKKAVQDEINNILNRKHFITEDNSIDKSNHFADNAKYGQILPIYIYDCSLSLLIDALVDKMETPCARDIFQDHTFKIGEQLPEEFITLKSIADIRSSTPEPKSEDSDNIPNDQRNLLEHCKAVSLAHCNAYVLAVYKTLILQQPLSYEDMEAAVDQCEEAPIEINITNYLYSVCKHLRLSSTDPKESCIGQSMCNDVQPLHDLIKEKFRRIMNVAFRPIPTYPELYYCLPPWNSNKMRLSRSQQSVCNEESEDCVFHITSGECNVNNAIEIVNSSANKITRSEMYEESKLSSCHSTESFVNDFHAEAERIKDHPLFLQLICSIHSKSSFSSTAVKLLPTCFAEIANKLEDFKMNRDISDLKITLDVIRLNLPREVLEVESDNVGLRSISYCSSPVGNMRTEDESNLCSDTTRFLVVEHLQDDITHLPPYQHNAILSLVEEIEWLLQDEIATALLDSPTPSGETLSFVARHVADSNERSSCCMDKVPLHFVFSSDISTPIFLEELKKLNVDRYCIRQEGNLFYCVKNDTHDESHVHIIKDDSINEESSKKDDADLRNNVQQDFQYTNVTVKKQDSSDPSGCHSEVSSIGDEPGGTDDGYEGDSSNSEDDCHWLIELDKRRKLLPNFWLILLVESNQVNVYFHCRFLELPSREVTRYQQVQKIVISEIKDICRRVNQYLLLRSLHDTRICDPLLEVADNCNEEQQAWRAGEAYNEATTATIVTTNHSSHNSTATHLTPSMFRCPIVWEVPFCLHPKLKTGPGRSGMSRGIKALHGVLNRFSVNNRSNMFVYQESNGNVFYLRLDEKISEGKNSFQSKLSESDEKLVVSRSSSVVSLSQTRGGGRGETGGSGVGLGGGQPSDQSYSFHFSDTSSNSSRPRVRSFGEKESNVLKKTGDSIVLMVHGISDAGPEIRHELVQVLQNRLDDAVLEVLSVMLARNPMCKLTPADVHFIQKPYRPPETIVRLSVQPHCLSHLKALGYYLNQNILQFLYIPKYTDHRAHYHFQDYSQPEGSKKRVAESDIFLYNQSHASGSRGIACIAMAIIDSAGDLIATDKNDIESHCHCYYRRLLLHDYPSMNDFENLLCTYVYDENEKPDVKALIEFKIWKQGRVNIESLKDKLRAALRHSIWDLVTEYVFLPTALTVPISSTSSSTSLHLSSDDHKNCNFLYKDKEERQELQDEKHEKEEKKEINKGHEGGKQKTEQEKESEKKDKKSGEQVEKEFHDDVVGVVRKEKKELDEATMRMNENGEKTYSDLNIDQYQLGETGVLHSVYHTTLARWFQFGLEIAVPAVKKHVVTIEQRHSLPVTLRELQSLIQSYAPDVSTRIFVHRERQPFLRNNDGDDLYRKAFETGENANVSAWLLSKASGNDNGYQNKSYVPFDFGKDDRGIAIDSILIARNFMQWKISLRKKLDSDNHLIIKDQKLVQKYSPLISENTFVPRQRFLLAKVQREDIVLYIYNWSKERYEKFMKHVTKLGMWLSSRSALYSSITMQKLGIFHHQATRIREQEQQQINDVESLAKFPHTMHIEKEWPLRPNNRTQFGKNVPSSLIWHQSSGQVMRDVKPSTRCLTHMCDPVVKAGYEFQDVQHSEKKAKDDFSRLYTMWQNRNTVSNMPISLITLNTFKQHSRLIHYCHTPLLFLPTWRLQSAATRDHSLTPSTSQQISSNVSQYSAKSKSQSVNVHVVSAWHKELCNSIMSEYKQYLQILGFNPIHVESQGKTSGELDEKQAFYLQKSMLGGMLLFDIHLSAPFFTVTLRVIESSRLQTKSSSALINQFMLSFLDACEKIKINMHLHSFTYDFHLRCIHSYIAGIGHWSLQHGYHLTHFLDDFNKYYSKAPNYARNLAYSGVIKVNELAVPASTLYSYLLSNQKMYGMQVFSMCNDSENAEDNEYVLVKLQSTPLISYCDAQDTKYTDDFDVALIVSCLDEQPFSTTDSYEITLKYYLMLTSKRELYPKREVEDNKLGKFRTVYSVVKSMSTNSQGESPMESGPNSTATTTITTNKTQTFLTSSSSSNQTVTSSKEEDCASGDNSDNKNESNNDSNDEKLYPEINNKSSDKTLAPTPPPVPDSPLLYHRQSQHQHHNHHHQQHQHIINTSSSNTSNLMQIRQESINYLGYYSSHEQLMQQMIMSQAQAAREHITNMIQQGALHCRTHLLWNKLLENRTTMTYAEFTELRTLALVEPLSSIDPRLSIFVNQPISWYQALAKVLQNKYQEYHKQFNAPDGNIIHHLILHPSYVQAFMMLTIDLHTPRGELYAVYRKTAEISSFPFSIGDIYSLVEGFVNVCCFHLWSGLYS